MADLWRRFLEARAILGLHRVLTLAPRWAIRRDYVAIVRDLAAPRFTDASRGGLGDLHWAPLDDGGIRHLRAMNSSLSSGEIRRRLREGQECLLGWLGPMLVYYRWDTNDPAYLPFLGAVFSPMEGDTLVVEAFTLPAYRARGIHHLASIRRLEAARAQGMTRSVTFVAGWHAPSLRVGLVKVSGRVAGTVTLWSLGPLSSLRVTGDVRLTAGRLSVAGPMPAAADRASRCTGNPDPRGAESAHGNGETPHRRVRIEGRRRASRANPS